MDNFGPEANPEAVARLEALGVRWPEEFVYQAWNEACTAPETAAVSIEVAAKLPEVIAYDEWVAARSDDSETWTDAEWAEHDALYETYEKAYDRQLIEIEEIVNLLREDCDAQ